MRACLVSSGHLSDSSRVSEVSGNRFLDLGIGIHQPQDDEERHHGGDEIGVRYFPRPAMVSRVPFHFAYDDNRPGLLLRHTSLTWALEFINHKTMKSAIMAVTKSAYATFHAPPWGAAGPFILRTDRKSVV